MTTQWRATGPFIASSALFTGILDETQLFLQTYAEQEGSVDTRVANAKQLLVESLLPQRSRASRKSIVERISRRLISWNPPAWVLDDLALFAAQSSLLALKSALLLHVCRQDQLLYALVLEVVVPKWSERQTGIDSADVQRFLDGQLPQRPEIENWTRQTRERLGGTTLSLLRDYGLLQGRTNKQIVEPIVPDEVVRHVVRLLREEGISEEEIPSHPDWRLWLWNEERTRGVLSELTIG
ncbi:MAG: DUF1819 family protein [Caldilineaceae bacterium]|nr:DUF1819 family protein [Caldilineaceae bacterium]